MRNSLIAALLLLAGPALAEDGPDLVAPSDDEPAFMSGDPADSFFGSAPSPLGSFGDDCPPPGEGDGRLRLDCPADAGTELKLMP